MIAVSCAFLPGWRKHTVGQSEAAASPEDYSTGGTAEALKF